MRALVADGADDPGLLVHPTSRRIPIASRVGETRPSQTATNGARESAARPRA